jgi:hypothetical protein
VDAAVAGPHRDLASGQRGGELELLIPWKQKACSRRQCGLPLDGVNDAAKRVLCRRREVWLGTRRNDDFDDVGSQRFGVHRHRGDQVDGRWAKHRRRHRHRQRLMRAAVIIAVHPGIDRLLSGLDAHEGASGIQKLAAQRLVEAFDLAGRRRGAGFGQSRGDAVLATYPFEQNFSRIRLGEPTCELFPVVCQHF